MENLNIAFQVVLPLLVLISVGYGLQYFKIVKQNTFEELNYLVFKVFLPILLFNNMLNSSWNTIMNIKLVFFAVMSVILIYISVFFLMIKNIKDKCKAATMIQGMYRSNFALFGIAITESMYGGNNTEVTTALVAIIVPLYNILSVILFNICGEQKIFLKKIIKGIVSNPLIIGSILGVLLNICNIRFPLGIQNGILQIGNMATPIALIVLGGTFSFTKLSKNALEVFVVVVSRLILIPIIFVSIAFFCGFRDRELFALFIMYASPTAVASFSMASTMGGDGELAGQIVVLTTIISLVTCILGIFCLKQVGGC